MVRISYHKELRDLLEGCRCVGLVIYNVQQKAKLTVCEVHVNELNWIRAFYLGTG